MIFPHQALPCLALLLLAFWAVASVHAQTSTNALDQMSAVQAEKDAAIKEVQRIVNQPVTRLPRNAGMKVAVYKPGWFHEGAIKPDFNTVDVRKTQETIYAQNEYVSSDLNPGMAFLGRQLEFNSMTKYFYLDRSLPKKKLSQEEMLEINRLYRIIGRCEQQLARLQNPAPTPTSDAQDSSTGADSENRPRLLNPYTGGALLVVAILVLYFSRKWRTR